MGVYQILGQALDERGFYPATKNVVLRGGTIAALFILIGAAMLPWNVTRAEKLLWFGVIGLLAIWNFYSLAGIVHANIQSGWRKTALKLFFSTQIRLFGTAILVYLAYAYCGAPLIPMLVGVALPMLCILISICLPRG